MSMTHQLNIREFVDPNELMSASITICNHYYAELGLELWEPVVYLQREGDRYRQPCGPLLDKYQDVQWIIAPGPISIRHHEGELLPEEYGSPRYRVSLSFSHSFDPGLVDRRYEVVRDLIAWIEVHGGTGRFAPDGMYGPGTTVPFARFTRSTLR